MTSQLTEDDLYRTSTQFKLWSFAPNDLASIRSATHKTAIDRASTYLPVTASCITLEDEHRLIQRYCEQIRSTSDHFKWPINVKATAVQYLKRFYINNSCMTYPPKDIYKSILFLASKTEGTPVSLSEYARRISTDPQAILAPEYKIIQALRFTLDVRQPYRGLKGTLMELLNMVDGTFTSPSSAPSKSAADIKQGLITLDRPTPAVRTSWIPGPDAPTAQDATNRIHAAYTEARQLLDAPALLTDAFLLYTPPQIHLGALYACDPELTGYYLSTRLPESDLMTRITDTIAACGKVLSAFEPGTVMSKDERTEIEARLEECRDPDTRDLVASNAAAKRGDGDEDEDEREEKKRRKLEKEAKFKQEGEDLFGPSL